MKKKYSDEYVKNELAKYGYTVKDDFKYQGNTTYFPVYDEVNGTEMNITWKNFNYYVKKGRKKYKRPDIMNIGLSEKESRPKDSFERWAEKQDDYIDEVPESYLRGNYPQQLTEMEQYFFEQQKNQ